MSESQQMRTIDKVLEILQRTNDGAKLSPRDLRLLELGVNGALNEQGEEVIGEIHQAVLAGTYRPQWFHGIEHMLQDHAGYITWKGRRIEHYSYRDVEAERAAALELAGICHSLEKRDFAVTANTVSLFSPFHDAPKGSPWVDAMLCAYCGFAHAQDPRGVSWVIFHVKDGAAIAVNAREETPIVMFEPETPGAFGSYTLFHRLSNMGLESILKPLHSHETFVQSMEQAGLTPAMLAELLARDYGTTQAAA